MNRSLICFHEVKSAYLVCEPCLDRWNEMVEKLNSYDDLLAMAKAYYQTLPDDGPEQDHYIRILEKAEGK